MSPAGSYRGRFAPSPTGPLHFGSLVTALASFLDARHHQGKWLVRIEDIDPPREPQGATRAILNSLEAHHLHWDGNVLYQSQRSLAYREALDQLSSQGLTYLCTCRRQDRQANHDDLSVDTPRIYNGHCRHLKRAQDPAQPAAIRLNMEQALQYTGLNPRLVFDDLVLGHQHQHLLTEVGDFVIHRKDGLFAYQLAVVVDDIFQNITHIIRGADLLDSTARQILLFRLFNAPVPGFGHLPLVLNEQGQKLSKQNLAPALDDDNPTGNIFRALQFLGQTPPTALEHEAPDVLLQWAIRHWQMADGKC